jgi:hypothetical protein
MLTKKLSGSDRDGTRGLLPGDTVTTVPVAHDAANAARWTESTSLARRMRRQRRLDRAQYRPISGWSLRTW